jgi:hypothetical protein
VIDEAAAMRAWLDAHGLGDGELLHSLSNHGPGGADLLTDPERLTLSRLLKTRRTIIPGYRALPADHSVAQERPGAAESVGLFDQAPDQPPERSKTEPAHPTARRQARYRQEREREERER